MKVLKKDQSKITPKYLKEFKEKFHREYNPRTDELLPVYHLLDDEGNQVIKQEKIYDPVEEKKVIVKTPVIFTQFQINNYRKMGQQIDIVTEDEIKAEKEKLQKLLSEAYEKGKKDASKKDASKK